MARLNILVTGVGAIIGYGIINSLRKTNRELHIVGMDIYDDAVGQYFCDHFIQAKRADSPEYLDFLVDVMKRNRIDLVFFGTEQEMYKVSDSRNLLPEIIHRFVLNSKISVDISKDKFKTYSMLQQHGIEPIRSRIDGTFDSLAAELGIPFLLKLRQSHASKGMTQIHDEVDYNYWRGKAGENFMVQEIVGDDFHEYTVATFGLGKGKCLPPFVLLRKLSGEGATAKAIVEDIPELAEEVGRLAKIFEPIGPTNFQFRLHRGKFLLLEINPRISASTSIRAAFGYNEAELCIQHFVEHRNIKGPQTKLGKANRYVSDWIIHENGFDR